ncbi:Lysozyme g [Labeo rohita]|uniref:Lysozyme g n=1 Tax=Labeo rohita TaxID=84645 RepID=A0ABQ8M2S6_LABRO|nr:Lysozyme g [Labeo rohita]
MHCDLYQPFPFKGVEASKKLAEHDLARMEQYKSKIIKVGRANQMDPAVIAAIISRESRAGAALKNGWGDHGNGFGLMQVGQKNRFTFFKKCHNNLNMRYIRCK